MDLEGRLLGNRYEIIEKIGNGGMAMVYKAKCHVLNRFVAVKILRDEFTTDQEFIKRFEVEAQAAASITHPNIVSVYDVGKEGNLYYIVMELIQGKTLKEIIVEEEGPLPWKWSINIAIQIASALEVAHKNNIVHRDIKPHNIIITEDGVAKVTDFGIAKAVSNSTITAFGTTIGSVHYFSPEHARGGYTDAKSDLYSLGVVMYEMLTGKVPFDADTPVSIALKHMQEEPKAPKELNEKIPVAVNDIILKSMRKDTNLRYQNAASMLSDLKRALKDPEGNFVDNQDYEENMPTQKISIKDIEEEANKTETNRNKKENKFIGFIKKHKGASIFIALVLLFALSLGGTILYSKLTNPKEVLLPNLVGISEADAKKTAEELGLVLEVSSRDYNSEYAADYIISQDPLYSDNYNVKKGSSIKIVVSKGIEEAVVPNVAGKEKEDAIKLIEEAKLKYQIVEEESKKIEAGYVISQETEANKTVYAGDTIVIHVSKGTKKVSVTSVIGKQENDAKGILSPLGLDVSVTYDEDTSKENGVVLKQSIDAGKEVEEGTKITLTVNKLTETKSATLTVNVKSLLGGKVEYEENSSSTNNTNDTNTTTPNKTVKNVEVKITVGTDTVYKNKIDPTTTNLYQTISGKGTVTVKVYIDDVLKSTKDVNLNNTNSVVIE
jgi:serine/threonine protein kinase